MSRKHVSPHLHFCLLIIAYGLLTASASGVTLRAGVAKVDITPPTGLPMWGYFARKMPSKGILDPLYARVLVLEVGEKRLALVALDLGRTFGPASIERLREAARRSSNISYALVVASHTHAGPVIREEYSSGVPTWETEALEKIGKAIDEATAHLVESRLGTDYGVVHVAHNRRRVNPDGTVTMFWSNPTKVPTAPVDPTVSVLRVDTADGKPLAVLVNYSCHPAVFGFDNLQYSADFPGVMTRIVEQAFGDQPLCFFLQGAPGDIDPYYGITPLEGGAVEMCKWTGERLGREATRVAKEIHTELVPQPSLQFAEDMLTFRWRWNVEKLPQALLVSPRYGPDIFKTYFPRIRPELGMPVTTVLINKRIALMGVPGEPFVDFQIDWRNRCPVPDAFFLGYANGWYGYFPSIHAASEGGYGTANAMTWVEVGAGERMVDHALVKVYEMLGRLTDFPEKLEK